MSDNSHLNNVTHLQSRIRELEKTLLDYDTIKKNEVTEKEEIKKVAEIDALTYQENLLYISNTALKFLTFSDEDDIFIFIGKRIARLVPKSIIIVFSYDQKKNISQIRYISGIYSRVGQILNDLGKAPEDYEIEIPRKFKAKYLSTKNLMVVEKYKDVMNDQWFAEPVDKIQKLFKVSKVYTMGMSRKGNLYGGLIIGTRNAKTKIDAPLIETVIYQAGIALHRKQIEIELVKAKEAAEASDRLKSAFLTNMSHEVRTPLNGILGFAQLLQIPNLDQNTHNEYVKMILESGNTLLTLMEDIMDVSKIESKQLKIKHNPFKINLLMDQMYSFFLANPLYIQKHQEQKITLSYRKHPEDVSIMSDVERLQQILINLIGNALKFTVKGHVEFGYEIEKKEILFYVEDTGIGIPKEKQDTVFDRFMQADNTLTRKFGGSGLGLAISKGLVELLDGKIWCESVPDKGSTFYFTIPYRPANLLISSETTDNNDDLFTSNWKQYHILVVEDDAVNGKIIEAMLKPSKVKLALADSGPVAIDYVKRHRNIDLILMDVHLPEMNGLEAAKIILNQHPGMRIIAQTANAMSNDKDKCIEAGCVDYISKPFDMKNLLAKIAKHLPEKPNG